MSEHLLIIDKPKEWDVNIPGLSVISPREYIDGNKLATLKRTRVINLCRDYTYLSFGYYCSLLAEARGQRVLPTVRTLRDLSRRSYYRLELDDLESTIQKALGQEAAQSLSIDIYFGQSEIRALRHLARQIFAAIRAPLLRVKFARGDKGWMVSQLRAIPLSDLDIQQCDRMIDDLQQYMARPWRGDRPETTQASYDLAILYNPDEKLPPSDLRTLKKFIRAGKYAGLDVELIQREDYDRLAEYDALFIRETTGIEHYTYRFARKALAQGQIVIDDPDSILRCANKIYLAELLRSNRIPTPKTLIVNRRQIARITSTIGFPVVLKIPDGSFSRGVHKVENTADLKKVAAELFRESDLILAQEFLYTPFDWRIGILNQKPLFACQYFMSKQHWQIINHNASRSVEGDSATLAVEDVPPRVLQTALKAANLIGDGLYGVDLKQIDDRVVVIEVNDNPNIDTGVEDLILKDDLYNQIMNDFRRRLDESRGRNDKPVSQEAAE